MNERFIRIREIGRGGMATVYLAQHVELNRLVAIKELHERIVQNRLYVRRFQREVNLSSRLIHPHIVAVLESHLGKDSCYLVMEYLAGGDFKKVLSDASFPLPEKLTIMWKIVQALDYAHQRGVIHRDIKPANILLTDDQEPKLTDFGIATSVWGDSSTLTETSEVMGTFDYIAPEQKESAKRVDCRADIFSVGVILYQCITGSKPAGAFRPPRELVPEIGMELDQLVMKCLQPQPADRFQSTFELAQALERILQQKTTSDGNVMDLISGLPSCHLSERIQKKAYILQHVLPADADRLLKMLGENEDFVKEVIIEALGKIRAKQSCSALSALVADPRYCRAVCAALSEIRCPGAEAALLRLLKSGNEFSHFALPPLAAMGSSQSWKFMVKFLQHEHGWIRKMAVEAIAMIKHRERHKYLAQVAQQDPEADIRSLAKNFLWRSNHEKNER